jgi:hypothetical protein
LNIIKDEKSWIGHFSVRLLEMHQGINTGRIGNTALNRKSFDRKSE